MHRGVGLSQKDAQVSSKQQGFLCLEWSLNICTMVGGSFGSMLLF